MTHSSAHDVVAPSGLLAQLQAKGYSVEISAAHAAQNDPADDSRR